MASPSVSYRIMQDLQTILRGAGLQGIDVGSIRIRELPTANETIAPTPAVLICPHGAVLSDAMGTEGSTGRVREYEVCLVDASEGDFATDQEKRMTWHEQAVNAIERDSADEFRTTLANVPEAWSVEIKEAPTFDRSKLSVLYAYQSVVVTVRCNK